MSVIYIQLFFIIRFINPCVLINYYCKKKQFNLLFLKRQRWQIVDIVTAQQQLTTLKKEDQRIPKCTHGVS
jgi:hypothetical protein